MEKENFKNRLKDDSIGEILLNFQKINELDIEKILDLQKEKKIYFGEAVIKLGLASKEDVELAIAYQFAYPYLSKNDNTISKKVIAAYSPFAPQVEAVRHIRTALLLSGVGGNLKSVCIAGCREGSGEIFVGANLAVVFAQLGHKTLLMDFNLRTPKIHRLFHLDNSAGVSTLLVNRSILDEVIKTTPFNNLDVLPSGPQPPNPLELMTRKEASQLMKTLQNSYEIIIVRTSGFERASDISLLASFMDSILIVVLEKNTLKNELEKAKILLEGAKARLLGVVYNQQPKI